MIVTKAKAQHQKESGKKHPNAYFAFQEKWIKTNAKLILPKHQKISVLLPTDTLSLRLIFS
jgi:hypothetical protein